jgi:hypothetical protein
MAEDFTYGSVSPELDELSSTLMGDALDLLAEGSDLDVLVVVEKASGEIESLTLSDDSEDQLLEGAHEIVRTTKGAVRYAIAYEAAIEMDDGTYADALLVEFGEKGRPSFSAYSLFEGKGMGDDFGWTDPAPAGEVDQLLG